MAEIVKRLQFTLLKKYLQNNLSSTSMKMMNFQGQTYFIIKEATIL